MFWGSISLDSRTDLQVIDKRSLKGVRYRDEVLRPIVRPFAGAAGPGFILAQDNSQAHTARVVIA